ncbi:succinylglutamate desuccinylase [Acerihabitans sp. TG2]|uniref:succinylglutamate desuccinylase n=1 Tax=Acerihabitans sp. TG2 TaxID=3096008 RepID=UPI002B2367A3|nr:succinylglutamate desuccinylase [Acerihabitans sp. TG2]MEA9391445.1 succinylglutamate desuccinylase [Acerihabitans sp. TG2]
MSNREFLHHTLAGTLPAQRQGEAAGVAWRWLDQGVMELSPSGAATATVVLSAGVHGNETAPVELLADLLDELLSGRLRLAVRLLVILGNPAALCAGQRYVVNDMNRMFGQEGTAGFTPSGETVRSQVLRQHLLRFFAVDNGLPRWHLDLHTAIRGSLHPRFALLPFQVQGYAPLLLSWLEAAALDALVTHRTLGATFTHFSSESVGALSATLELGKALPFGANDLHQFHAIRRALAALVSGAPLPERDGPPLRRYQVSQQITRHSPAFALLIPEDTLNFTAFARGELLAREPGREYRVEQAQEWILFPNPAVALGLRAGLMLVESPGEAG